MYLDNTESIELAKNVFAMDFDPKKIEVAIFPSLLSLSEILQINKSAVKIGCQNFDYHEKGAYTGEVSIFSLKKIDCQTVLVGHSERRYVFGEDGKVVKNKFVACLENGIKPVLCIGEKKEEKENNLTFQVLANQLQEILSEIDLKEKQFILAYEPVWAIGSGNPCLPQEAQKIISFLKEEIKKYTELEIPILYGGSVNYENVIDFLQYSEIDGVLVGSDSSKKENFQKMLDKVSKL